MSCHVMFSFNYLAPQIFLSYVLGGGISKGVRTWSPQTPPHGDPSAQWVHFRRHLFVS